MKINVFWFRRDLRLEDNTALNSALDSRLPVLPVFIFDTNITDDLRADDPRISFIHESLLAINSELNKSGSSLYVLKSHPERVWRDLARTFDIHSVFANKDYEPYGIKRDKSIEKLLAEKGTEFHVFKDHVIFEENEILKSDRRPYTVFTPYKNSWIKKLKEIGIGNNDITVADKNNYYPCNFNFPSLGEIGFSKSTLSVRQYDLSVIPDYHKYRDFPASDLTSYLSPHLRFGTVSIRKIVDHAMHENESFLNELIWREFFMQILFHFPDSVTGNFRKSYDNITWRNNEKEFKRWCDGETGYPIVDAGMRQLNKSGYMHNRVRMITAGFLCKHLLIDWRWGEAYFAEKLLDYELSSNIGNWQWAAGTGCDAVPYFRIFNPEIQQKKYDPELIYIKRWIEDIDKSTYPVKIVDHDFARERAINTYKTGLKVFNSQSGH